MPVHDGKVGVPAQCSLEYGRCAKKWRVQACQRGAFVRLIGPNVDPPVWDCPAFGATTIGLTHLGARLRALLGRT